MGDLSKNLEKVEREILNEYDVTKFKLHTYNENPEIKINMDDHVFVTQPLITFKDEKIDLEKDESSIKSDEVIEMIPMKFSGKSVNKNLE